MTKADETHPRKSPITATYVTPRIRELFLMAREKSLLQGHVLSDFDPIFQSDKYFLARCVQCGAHCFVCLDNPPGFEIQGRAILEPCLGRRAL